jgi:hypothetical protein
VIFQSLSQSAAVRRVSLVVTNKDDVDEMLRTSSEAGQAGETQNRGGTHCSLIKAC